MSKKKPEITVEFERVDPQPIALDCAGHRVWLTGLYAWLYRGLIWMDGPEQAAAKMRSLLTPSTKSGASATDNAAIETL